MKGKKKLSVFEQIKAGLEDSIFYSRGSLSLVTVTLPAPAPSAGPIQIATLRKTLHMSQTVFAATLNVSRKTVQSWEQGIRRPSDASLRLLQIIGAEPGRVSRLLGTHTEQTAATRASKAVGSAKQSKP